VQQGSTEATLSTGIPTKPVRAQLITQRTKVTGRISGCQNKLFENSKVINTWGGTDIHPLHQLSEIYQL
jgi:hypothetical protein